MKQFLIRRFVFALISIVVATFLILCISRLSGDPLLLYANSGYGITEEGEKIIRERLGLDRNVFMQYVFWLGRTLKGDMGETILDRKPVSRIVFLKLPSTLQLGAVSWIMATIVGIPLGILSAVKRGTPDKFEVVGSLIIVCCGLFLIYHENKLRIRPLVSKKSRIRDMFLRGH